MNCFETHHLPSPTIGCPVFQVTVHLSNCWWRVLVERARTSSKVQRIMGPVSLRLMPWRVMDIMCPRYVMISVRIARCR
jgi:hypothetical protein